MKKSKITTATEPKLPMEGGRRFITNTQNPAVLGYYNRLLDKSITGIKVHLDLIESHYVGLPAATRGIDWDKLIHFAKQHKV